ncbi:MAG TPA: sensor domain-containing protein [Jatrophihabitantaceae bacterium]|nr:sensor domain-containing protein [Jatrophihabitantaceae bacterium]
MGQDGDVRKELALRSRLLGISVVSIFLTTLSLVLFVLAVADFVLIAVWVGIPLLVKEVAVTRSLTALHRRYAGGLLGEQIETPYLHVPDGSLLVRMRAILADPAYRRDLLWLFLDGTAGMFLAVLGVAEGLLDLLFWWLPPGWAVGRHARLSRAFLAPSEKSRLALRVQHLTESRAETVDTQAAELRRIERDLHDGAQARLVALGMSLAMAEEQLTSDPEGARALLTEARTASSAALAELRDLVRGIHPPVLADRGLVGAGQALGLAASIPVTVNAELAGRLPAPVESAGYFAIAEALTNVIKHANASAITIALGYDGTDLRVEVTDDGVGGADPARGTGLRGIARRLSAFDGTLVTESPPGGPTRLVMVLPCASSSPKTSPSSGTA